MTAGQTAHFMNPNCFKLPQYVKTFTDSPLMIHLAHGFSAFSFRLFGFFTIFWVTSN